MEINIKLTIYKIKITKNYAHFTNFVILSIVVILAMSCKFFNSNDFSKFL